MILGLITVHFVVAGVVFILNTLADAMLALSVISGAAKSRTLSDQQRTLVGHCAEWLGSD